MQLAPATPDDAAEVARVHVASWRAAYAGIVADAYLAALSVEERAARWKTAIASGESTVLVAREGKALLGWVSFGPSRDPGADATQGEIWALYVDPAHWARQVGRVLMGAALDALAANGRLACSLWVFPQNTRAIGFYRALGFEHDGQAPQTFELGGQVMQEVRYVRALQPSAGGAPQSAHLANNAPT